MDTLQCAVVLAKLERFEWELGRRQALAARYTAGIAARGIAARPVVVRDDRDCVYAQYTVLVERRDDVQRALTEQGVPTSVHYPLPLHRQPAYRDGCCAECCPVSDALAASVLCLPMSAALSETDQDIVLAALAASLR